MSASFYDSVSIEPAGHEVPLPNALSIFASEQSRSPSQRPDEHEQSPFDADVHSIPPDDDPRWDVFLPDDDEIDPMPEPGDFWVDVD